MSDDSKDNKLSLKRTGSLSLNKSPDQGQVRQSMSHGRHRMVQVEIKRPKRLLNRQQNASENTSASKPIKADEQILPNATSDDQNTLESVQNAQDGQFKKDESKKTGGPGFNTPKEQINKLEDQEHEIRLRALKNANQNLLNEQLEIEKQNKLEQEQKKLHLEMQAHELSMQALKKQKTEKLETKETAKEQKSTPKTGPTNSDEQQAQKNAQVKEKPESASPGSEQSTKPQRSKRDHEDEYKSRSKSSGARAREQERRLGRLSIARALEEEAGITRMRSLAALKRARIKERNKNTDRSNDEKIIRDVTIPETISISDLANRMAERSGNLIKTLLKLGVIATQNQIIDADTAELVATEMGHRVNRVAEDDVETVLKELEPEHENRLKERPSVVTVMGHVDHGKTSLLDALRQSDVASKESGGITQHIGAYNVTLKSGKNITFIDTPGHQAFTAMRARGAQATDIIILVVAADDGIQPQTIEAINHANAAKVPIIVAINKIDRVGVDTNKVKNDLMKHNIIVESMGGDILDIEISALKKINLDKLEEAILLQAELLELKADHDIAARGIVIETKLEKGRGPMATVLIQKGTLKPGDSFIAGNEWGRVRAMIDARSNTLTSAGPSMPVEIVGAQGLPEIGQEFYVLESEQKAREIAEYRKRKHQDLRISKAKPGTLEQMFKQIREGKMKEVAIVLKADTQGSLEAIKTALQQLSSDEVGIHILHDDVGGINESDIRLASASSGLVIGFNVRANPQAKDQAISDRISIRYYSIIYELLDDLKKMVEKLLTPEEREQHIGYAEIREVFNISKIGKIAGCIISEGIVKRGSSVRILRNDTVIYEGRLKQLKRFKDDVKEVKNGFECGIGFENFDDLKANDRVECFDIIKTDRVL